MRRAFDLAFWPVVIVLAVVLPPLYNDSYVMAELVLFGIYFAINLMWSLVLGTAGLYSFATLAFVEAMTATYISASLVLVSLFLLIAVVLLVRPRGIAGILESTRA